MLNVVDESTMVKKMQKHTLYLEKTVKKVLDSQEKILYHIEKLENFNISSVVRQVLKELNTPENLQTESFDDLLTFNAKITAKNFIKRKQTQ